MHALVASNRLLVLSIIDSLMARQREGLSMLHYPRTSLIYFILF